MRLSKTFLLAAFTWACCAALPLHADGQSTFKVSKRAVKTARIQELFLQHAGYCFQHHNEDLQRCLLGKVKGALALMSLRREFDVRSVAETADFRLAIEEDLTVPVPPTLDAKP